MFNKDITIYNAYKDKIDKTLKYRRVYLRGVYFKNLQQGQFNTQGGIFKDSALCIIPFLVDSDNKKYLSALEYKKVYEGNADEMFFDSFFTIQKGSKIIKGIVDSPLLLLDLLEIEKGYDDCFTIKSIAENDFGSEKLGHWEVRG